MQKKFLIHKIHGIYMVVDRAGIGPEMQSGGNRQFQRWHGLEDYFFDLGASREALDKAKADIETDGTAKLLIQRALEIEK